jgi:hypothetical protein
MDMSLITALMGAQTGMLQLAVAVRLARTDQQNGASVAQLIDAAQQSFDPLANVAARSEQISTSVRRRRSRGNGAHVFRLGSFMALVL